MRSNAGPLILLAAILALFGGYAWLTHHPEAEILQRAESWPFIGPLASDFRERYAPPPSEATEDDGTYEVEFVEPVVPPLGEGFVWVVPGTAMRREPDQTSPKILQFDVIANVTRLERRGDWYKVWRRGLEGWVYLEGYADDEPPYGSDSEPPRPLPSRVPEPEALEAARAYLGERERVLVVGPYQLYTDSRDEVLLGHLDRVAARLEDAYVERFRRRPIDKVVHEAVVLYDNEAIYREIQNRTDRLLGIGSRGHTASGLVILYVGARPRWEAASTLIHELTHTLNRRSIGPALPSWLDEGLSDDLAYSLVGDDGRLELGSIGGERVHSGNQFTLHGAVASLWDLRDEIRAGRLIHVRELLHLDWDAFVRSADSERNYAAAAFWIRFLLEGNDGRLVEPFRGYLESVSHGEPSNPDALQERLGLDWNVLNARYQLWLEFQRPVTRVTASEADE